MVVITISEIIKFIILGIFIIAIIIMLIKSWLDTILKKNCYKCKHYGFYSTFSAGQNCQYKCYKKDRIDVNDINETEHYEKCNNFELKE